MRRGDATLMLADLPDGPASDAPASAHERPNGPAPPSARVQWALVAVNATCVILVLVAVAYIFLR